MPWKPSGSIVCMCYFRVTIAYKGTRYFAAVPVYNVATFDIAPHLLIKNIGPDDPASLSMRLLYNCSNTREKFRP